jgi:hypothetical protein
MLLLLLVLLPLLLYNQDIYKKKLHSLCLLPVRLLNADESSLLIESRMNIALNQYQDSAEQPA